MADDDGSTVDPGQQGVTISSSDYPSLYMAVQCSSADDLLQNLGIDPNSVSDDNNLPVA